MFQSDFKNNKSIINSITPNMPSVVVTYSKTFELFVCFVVLTQQAAFNAGVKDMYGLNKRVVAVSNTRKLTKLDMKWNDALPNIQVDPDHYDVKVDGDVLTCLPATTLPLSRDYFLF